jgi:hypothetical protein
MGLFSPFVRAQAQMQALPMLRRSEVNTTSYVADYLTRSVRRASGFVLVGKPEAIRTNHTKHYQPPLRGTDLNCGLKRLNLSVRMHLAAALAERTPQPQASESQGSREPLDAWYNFLRVNSAIKDDALHGGWNLLHDLDDARFAHSKGLSEQISEWRTRNGEIRKEAFTA